MKISLYLPRGCTNPRAFLQSELSQARNIKNKTVRKAVTRGLTRLLSVDDYEGKALFSDGEELVVEPYEGRKRHYHCGRDYVRVEVERLDPYLLVVVDGQSAAVGTTDGDGIRVLWSGDSLIMGKHGRGGQSQRRFERGREEAVKQWLRKVRDVLRAHDRGQDIIVGGAGMTKNRFVEELPI